MALHKVIRWSLGIVLIVLVLGAVGFFIGSDHLANGRHLRRIEAELAALPIPPQTQRLASQSALGILGGNGNHCDFFVGSLFRSSLTVAAIREHYAGRTFYNPVTSTQEHFQVSILVNPENFKSPSVWLPDSMDRPEAWGVSSEDFASGTVFLVTFFESYPANNDCRCH